MSKRIIGTFLYTQASKPELVQHSEVQTRAQRSQLTSRTSVNAHLELEKRPKSER